MTVGGAGGTERSVLSAGQQETERRLAERRGRTKPKQRRGGDREGQGGGLSLLKESEAGQEEAAEGRGKEGRGGGLLTRLN